VAKFTLFVLPDFKNDGIQEVAHPTDGHVLLRNIRPLIEPIRSREQLLRLFETDAAPWIRSETLAFSRIEAKPHLI
jgi:hypothetical protein